MNINISSADPIVKRLQTVQHLIDSGKLQEAAERLQTVAKSAPGDPRVYLIGMRLAEAAGQPKKAEDAARRAVKLTPQWPVAVVELALLLARQNRFDEAIVEAQRALKLASDSQEVVARVIEIAQRAQRWDLSIPWLLHAESLQPSMAPSTPRLSSDLARAISSAVGGRSVSIPRSSFCSASTLTTGRSCSA